MDSNYYVYEGVRPLVSTSLFALKLEFCSNSLRKALNFSVKSEVLTRGRAFSYT